MGAAPPLLSENTPYADLAITSNSFLEVYFKILKAGLASEPEQATNTLDLSF